MRAKSYSEVKWGMAIHFIEESAVSPPQAMYEQDR